VREVSATLVAITQRRCPSGGGWKTLFWRSVLKSEYNGKTQRGDENLFRPSLAPMSSSRSSSWIIQNVRTRFYRKFSLWNSPNLSLLFGPMMHLPLYHLLRVVCSTKKVFILIHFDIKLENLYLYFITWLRSILGRRPLGCTFLTDNRFFTLDKDFFRFSSTSRSWPSSKFLPVL